MTDALLVLNAGSSSIKFQLFDAASLDPLAKGSVGGIGGTMHLAAGAIGALQNSESIAGYGHDAALAAALGWIAGHGSGWRLQAIAHRVVHGGAEFQAPVIVTPEVIAALQALVSLAPLHQPHNLAGIAASARLAPHATDVACFDTAFHASLPLLAASFALPDAIRARGIRRFGFHGLSYEWIARTLRDAHPALAAGRVVAAHLGNGASLCALDGGRSVDTTMGLTPLDGVPMGTRSGAIDPGVVLHLQRQFDMPADAVERMLYEDAGLKGLSGLSNDVAVLLATDDAAAHFALDHFAYHVAKHVAAMAAAMGGIDALVFTGGIGEHAAPVRDAIVRRLAFLGQVPALVIPADEERMMAIHARALLRRVDDGKEQAR